MFKGGEKIKEKIDNLFSKIKGIKQKQPHLLLLTILVAAVFFSSWLVYKNYYNKEEISGVSSAPEELLEGEIANLTERKIDGVLVEEDANNLYPVAIMIENHWDARPAIGLAKANLVYEVMTEGGITRFLAFFANYDKKLEKIGPVRSARPYYVDWVSEFDALYMHVGGSDEALANIKRFSVKDLNEFYNGGYYWRSSRPRPHNVYTSSELMKKGLKLMGLDEEEGDYESWKYKDEAASGNHPDFSGIAVDYGSPAFLARWDYNKETNDYTRFMAGEKHIDEDGSEIKAKNVVVQYVKMWVIDDYGRKKIETIGEGRAVVFSDGEAIEGVWKKESRTSRTKFYDSTGAEIQFNRGTTWVEVVSKIHEVSWE